MKFLMQVYTSILHLIILRSLQ